jgi:hypothetical protein
MKLVAIVIGAVLVGACGDTTKVEKQCLDTSMMCGDTCVDVMSDQNNCGACGTVCGDTERCTAGACTAVQFPACPAGQTDCSGTCADTMVDANHCGTCDNACGPAAACYSGACETRVWEVLADSPVGLPMLSDFVDAGQPLVYATHGAAIYSYTFPTGGADTTGTWSAALATAPVLFIYDTPAWVGTTTYLLHDTSMYAYDTAGNSWSTPINATLTHSLTDAQVTHDDAGYVYAFASDQYLVQIKVSDNTATYVQGPNDLTAGEPRAAYDSLTKKVYLGDQDQPTGAFYAYDPTAQTFTALTAFPDPNGMNDAFCSDRKGHIFTANSGAGVGTDVWIYTAATNAWTQLPWLPWNHGDSASCTVSADGYLYFSNGNDSMLARIKL